MNTKRFLSVVMTIALVTMMFVPTGLAVDGGTASWPTSEPSDSPLVEPTAEPAEPTADPAVEPTADPTAEPMADPAAEPTANPAVEPTADPTVEPTAEPATMFKVEFFDWDGTLIVSLSAEKGADAVVPEHPVRLGYLPDGWDTDFTNVQKDLTVTALYTPTIVGQKFTDLDSAMLLAAESSYTVHLYVYVGNAPHNPPLLVHYTLTDISDTDLATLQGNQNWSTFFTNLDNATTVNLSNYIGLSASQYYGNGKVSLNDLGSNVYEVKVYLKEGSIATTYTVHYVDGDGNTVFPSVTKSGDVGDIVTESAPAAAGYVTPADKTITLGFSGNVITFVYISNAYTVTWNNYDGTQLEQDLNVLYGATPSYDGATPTRAATAQFTYTFDGWTPAVSPVTGNVTYTATYTSATNAYTVTWNNYDGTQLEQDLNVLYGATPSFNGATPTRGATAQFAYTFDGWTPAVSPVTGNVTYTATYTAAANAFTVTFVDFNGTVLGTDRVRYGNAATAPADPAREGYTFTGWDIDFDNVTSDLTVTAQYTIITFTVTFVDFDGTVLDTQEVTFGGAAQAPADPARDGYTFTGWDVSFNPVTSDLTVTALYELIPTQVDDEEIPQTVDEEPVPQSGPQQNLNWMWWLLLIPLLLLLLLWYNVTVIVYGPDENGKEKRLRTIRRLKRRKDEVTVSLTNSHTRGGAHGMLELTKLFTRRMRGNRLTIEVDGVAVLNAEVPDDAEGRFQARIEKW